MTNNDNNDTHCGYIALIGRPNVGKSTLLNRVLGEKLCITSRKPQTTRHKILGIKTEGDIQSIYVDTPGLHKSIKTGLNRHMNRTASNVLQDVDVIIWLVDATRWTSDDDWVLEKVKRAQLKTGCPVILALNKVDRIKEKKLLLPQLEALSAHMSFSSILPVSAKTGINVEELEAVVAKLLPKSPHFFPEDQITDRSERFLISELIREKLMRGLGQEVPYSTLVEIEEFKKEGNLWRISALILVEKPGQKAILIGSKGEQLKEIGRLARLEMEKRFERKIFLQLWVKIKSGWSDDERALRSLENLN
jgi:GTP-binding protein Era